MTLPIDTSGIDEPLPDLAHEAIRQAVITALQVVWSDHQSLVDQVTALQQAADDQAEQITELQTRVTALENPTPAA